MEGRTQMRRTTVLSGILLLLALAAAAPGIAHAQTVNLGVQTNHMQFGVNIGPTPPPLVAVPAPVVVAPGAPPPPPVYTAPGLPYNYFVYQNVYYVYHEGRWFRGRHHNGPWAPLAIAQVPGPILAVPVEHYRVRPAHWEHHGPPPWAHERDRERHEHGRGHEGDRHH